MSKSDAHCRICAGLKPYSKLVNLQEDQDRLQEVAKKLIRLSLEVTELNASDDALPKTVCLPCLYSLDTAFNFVINVEVSQTDLIAVITDTRKQKVISKGNISNSCTYEVPGAREETGTLGEREISNKSPVNCSNENQTQHEISSEDPIILSQIRKLSWRDYSWMCAYCDTMFPSIDELKQHSKEYHECCNPYRCIDCNIRKLNLDNFLKHVKRHKKYLKLACYKCHLTFTRPCDTVKHEKHHIATEFKCSGCNDTFATTKQLFEHINTYNKDKKVRIIPTEQLTEDFSCVFCSKKFKLKGGLTQHLLTHTDRKRDHTCDKCGKCFLNKSNLAAHLKLHDSSKQFQCEICQYQFRTLTQLRIHIGVHNGKKPFSCEQCGRRFRLKTQLNSHCIIHTDTLPFVCSYCNKGFRFKSTLNQHVHQHTGLRPYECEICHRAFTNWPNYNKHMKRRHNMNMSKRRNTPQGFLPINLSTVEVEIKPDTIEKWKKKVLDNHKRPGRPKSDTKCKGNITCIT